MDEEQRRLKRYKLMFARFNWMEQRYHTWMNYYSLFNGALLVAYCTILVSTGKIVEMEGNISNNGFTNLGAKLFYLNCTLLGYSGYYSHFRSYSQLLLVFVYDWTPELVEELEGNIEKRKEYAF